MPGSTAGGTPAATRLIPKTDPERAGRLHNVPVELHGAGAEPRAQQTVERRRPAAALEMTEHTYARFFAGSFLDFCRDHGANSAEPSLAIFFIARPEKSTAL